MYFRIIMQYAKDYRKEKKKYLSTVIIVLDTKRNERRIHTVHALTNKRNTEKKKNTHTHRGYVCILLSIIYLYKK